MESKHQSNFKTLLCMGALAVTCAIITFYTMKNLQVKKKLSWLDDLLIKRLKDLDKPKIDLYNGKIQNFDWLLKFKSILMKHTKMVLERREIDL